MKIHYKDIFTKESECGVKSGIASLDMNKVNCMECLKLIKKEWKRQVKEFTGYSRVNAIKGLKVTEDIIKEIKLLEGEKK